MYKYIFLTFVLLLSACSNEQATAPEQQEKENHEGHAHVTGDIQETTASNEQLPSFLDGQQDIIVQTYEIAGKYADVLQSMPCYCGCGESVGHRSNANCFIQERHADGSVTWDDHGTRCVVCLEIALQAAKLSHDGKSLLEIRQIIDDTYKEGYMPPTDTPMPA